MVEVLTPRDLYHRLHSILDSPFFLYTHVMTEPWASRFCDLPRVIRRYSIVSINAEKKQVSSIAAKRLASCGYSIRWIPDLHAKLIVSPTAVVVSTANFTKRSLRNLEVVLVFKPPPPELRGIHRVIETLHARRTERK